ncbi:unnamed protein product, partial [Dicrocoelium dendriticum]
MKHVSILHALYSKTTGRVMVYGHLSDIFLTSDVRQGTRFLTLFSFFLECTLGEPAGAGLEVLPGETVNDFEYTEWHAPRIFKVQNVSGGCCSTTN